MYTSIKLKFQVAALLSRPIIFQRHHFDSELSGKGCSAETHFVSYMEPYLL